MASDQLSRSDNTRTEREIYIEKQRVVPKMATHFESLADKATDSQAHSAAGAAAATGARQTPQGQVRTRTGNIVAHGFGTSGPGHDQKAQSRQRPEFESHAGKANDREQAAEHQGRSRGPIEIGKFEMGGVGGADQERRGGSIHQQSSKDRNENHKESGSQLSREEISNLRATAQQNSADAIRAAEERCRKEKERESASRHGLNSGAGATDFGKEKGSQQKESATRGLNIGVAEYAKGQGNFQAKESDNRGINTGAGAAEFGKDKGSQQKESGNRGLNTGAGASEFRKEKGSQQKESANRGINTGAGAGDYNINKGSQAADSRGLNTGTGEFAKEKGSQAKEISSGRQQAQPQASEKGGRQGNENVLQSAQNAALQAKDTLNENKDVAAEKIQQGYSSTRDTITSAGKTAVDYTAPVAGMAKDYAVKAAVTTKDVTIEKGKVAAEVAGKVAADVKDKAIAAGWSTAHYTTDKALDATMAVAGVVGGVAEYAGHKALDITAATGDTVKEFTARKKEEAARELEAKRSAAEPERMKNETNREANQDFGESTGGYYLAEENRHQRPSHHETGHQHAENRQQQLRPSYDQTGRSLQQREDMSRKATAALAGGEEEEEQSGLLGAIGETIVEIAQQTKELVIGPDEPKTNKRDYVRRK